MSTRLLCTLPHRRNQGLSLPLALLALLFLLTALPLRSDAQGSEVVPGEILVGMRPGRDDLRAPRLMTTVGKSMAHLSALRVHRVLLRPGVSIDQAVAQMRRQADVLFAEPNHIVRLCSVPNDTNFASQYALINIQADKAWDKWTPRAPVIIAIVDTGVDSGHPDLTNKILRDAQGIVGYDANTGLRNDALDIYGHGTHCAGIAAAQVNNGTSIAGMGMAGVAGWNGQAAVSDTKYTKIMPVRVFYYDASNNLVGTDLTVANGIRWAADNGAKVISLSLGGGSSSTLQSAVNYALGKHCVIVAAAGNSQSNALFYPAGYAGVISVAATDRTDTLAYFSNYGSWVLTAAPGWDIFSTLPTYATPSGFGMNYGNLYGTSMACPHVAGEAALIWAQNPTLTDADVKRIITTSVDPYKPYGSQSIVSGGGRINVSKALDAAGKPANIGLAPIADAFVRSGAYANTTNGTFSYLVMKTDRRTSSSDYNRIVYLKFDLTNVVAEPTTAALTLTINSAWPAGTLTPTYKVYSVADTSWTEAGITFNNAPGFNRTAYTSTGALVSTQSVTPGSTSVTFDLTSFVKANLGKQVTLQIMEDSTTGYYFQAVSREGGASKPLLSLVY